MKKTIALSLALVALAGVAFAGLSVIKRGSFSDTGTPAAAVEIVIPAAGGIITDTALCLSVETNATLTVRRPQYETTAVAASTTNTIQLYTTSSNVVQGFTLTTSDFLLVYNATSGFQLEDISAIGVYASGKTTYTLAANTAVAAGDIVYVIDTSDNVAIAGVASANQTGLCNMFTGYRAKPVHLSIPVAAGDVVLSGTYAVEQ